MKIEESPRISEFYKLVLDNLKDAVIFCNPIGICTYANKAAERLTGYKTEEMIGKNPRKIILRKYWPLCEKMNLIAALRGKTPVFEVEIKRKDGKIIDGLVCLFVCTVGFDVVCTLVFEGEGEGYYECITSLYVVKGELV